MARIQFDGESPSHVSKPVKRMRWASQHLTGQTALKQRMSIISRLHKPHVSTEEKQRQDEALPSSTGPEPSAESQGRTIYVNVPVPETTGDESNGHVKQHFDRNKIRTSKYTPLSFVPKNLWFQFHNVANLYFFFIIILGVRQISLH
jgi:phospholipid-translocating ATPase